MDAFFHSIWAARIITIFAVTNLILGGLVFLTCRCLPVWSPARSLMHNQAYLKLYKYHCYLWLFFLISVMIHAVFAVIITGTFF